VEKISEIGNIGHVSEYSRRNICEFFSEVGFNIVKISGRNRRIRRSATSAFSLLVAMTSYITSISDMLAQELVIVSMVEKDV